jgi:hypothetical protein
MEALTGNDLASSKSTSSFAWPTATIQTAGQIRFKAVLKKKTTTAQSPLFNSIRFRYRNQYRYIDLDTRFGNITVPAFLAAREQVAEEIQQGEFGWTTRRPMRWWVLPEANIEQSDIVEFLQGDLQGTMHTLQNLTKYQYGPMLQILHRGFETRFIRDDKDLMGIAYLLT